MNLRFWNSSLALASLFLATLSSCDSFLEVHPLGEKTEQDLFSTSQGTEDAIYGVYGALIQPGLYGENLLWGFNEVLAQNLSVPSGTLSTPLSQYDYTSSYVTAQLKSIWTDTYAAIGHANNALKNVREHSEYRHQNLYAGELIGLRAFLHFDLMRLYAPTDSTKQGIPYVSEFIYKVTPFSTVAQDYKRILADLDEAENLLSADATLMQYPRSNEHISAFENFRHTHFNLYAVWATKARVYLTMGDKAKAAEYALKVINSGKFPLVDRTEVKDFLAGYLSEKETIFGLYAPSYKETAQTYLFNQVTRTSYQAFAKGMNNVMEGYEDVYAADNDNSSSDYRTSHFEVGSSVRHLKLADYYSYDTSYGSRDTDGLIAGITMIRSAEMYLIAAEALLDTDPTQARKLFDQLLTARGLTTFEDRSLTLTEENIFNEFRKEFFGEGLTWYMMKRKNRDIKSNVENRVIKGQESIYVLPIPTDEYEYRY